MSVLIKYYPERENRRGNRGFILTTPAVYNKLNEETGKTERKFVNYVEFQSGENLIDQEVYQVLATLQTFKELVKADCFIVDASTIKDVEEDEEEA